MEEVSWVQYLSYIFPAIINEVGCSKDGISRLILHGAKFGHQTKPVLMYTLHGCESMTKLVCSVEMGPEVPCCNSMFYIYLLGLLGMLLDVGNYGTLNCEKQMKPTALTS